MDEIVTQETDLSTSPKPYIFVLMPFDKNFTDVYELGILSASTEVGAFAERLDKQIFTENMLQRIYHQIATADLIVADMTGKNPNVFYEVGYAHALDKKVILITKSNEDIPFDLKHYPHIIYENVSGLKAELKKRIPFLLRTNKKTKTFPIHVSLFQMDTRKATKGRYVNVDGEMEKPLEVTLQNRSDITQLFKIGIVHKVNSNFLYSECIDKKSTKHFFEHTKEVVYTLNEKIELYPNSPHTFETKLVYKNEKIAVQNTDTLTIRIFTENGSCDFDFTIEAR